MALLGRFVRRVWVVYPHLMCGRLVADALKDSIAELRKDDETRMSQYVYTKTLSEWHALTWRCHRFATAFHGEISALREGEENRFSRLVFPRVLEGAFWDQTNPVPL